ncbi:hypothetical protein [Bacillus cihuensis]|uniref:hypothetical protein n=1 Tax=Bacillus cihuensis TaxID=1208599 RepID=UPI00041FF343|nr:hypothetical protein [Bacillus cihuensis]
MKETPVKKKPKEEKLGPRDFCQLIGEDRDVYNVIKGQLGANNLWDLAGKYILLSNS